MKPIFYNDNHKTVVILARGIYLMDRQSIVNIWLQFC